MNITKNQLRTRLLPLRQKLYEARRKRKQPLLDTKIITSWNALMIRAMAHGGSVFSEKRYIDAAAKAADFLMARHFRDGTLFRTSRGGDPKHHGFLDDYAFLAQALLALHAATGEARWKQQAATVALAMVQKFVDDEAGGFFFTDRDATDLIVRQKTAQDSPLPSGNAVAVMALLQLGQVQGSVSVLAAFARQMAEQGESMSSMVQAALLYLCRAEPFTVSASSVDPDPARPPSPEAMAAGVVRVAARWKNSAELHLALKIAEGFHINAGETAGAEVPLIATRLTVNVPGAVAEYPAGEPRPFPFVREPIRVYSGQVIVVVRFSDRWKVQAPLQLTLSYQACDESSCLPPVSKQFEVEAPPAE